MKTLSIALLLGLTSPLAAQGQSLTPAQTAAALAALDDEYHALAFYQAVIDAFGNIKPFRNIIKAEAQHIAAVSNLLGAAGTAIPANPYLDGSKVALKAPATKAEACQIGVQAEIANAALYDDSLLPAAADNPALLQTFTALRDASQAKHLPALQGCAG